MKKSDNVSFPNARRRVQASTTLSRRYVERPELKTSVSRSSVISRFKTDMPAPEKQDIEEQENTPAEVHPLQTSAREKMNERKTEDDNSISAKELKDQAIKKALAMASKIEPDTKTGRTRGSKLHFSFGRIALASACAVIAVFAIVYFVNLNMPDMSLRVAAMQTGIDAKYPNYVPRGFKVTDITSESGKIVLNFKNTETETVFSITEESSSWDSNALLSNFVREEYGENYTTIKEQGLTIYISNSNATWVNGGIVFKIKTTSGSLTKKILTTIVTSGWKN